MLCSKQKLCLSWTVNHLLNERAGYPGRHNKTTMYIIYFVTCFPPVINESFQYAIVVFVHIGQTKTF